MHLSVFCAIGQNNTVYTIVLYMNTPLSIHTDSTLVQKKSKEQNVYLLKFQ